MYNPRTFFTLHVPSVFIFAAFLIAVANPSLGSLHSIMIIVGALLLGWGLTALYEMVMNMNAKLDNLQEDIDRLKK